MGAMNEMANPSPARWAQVAVLVGAVVLAGWLVASPQPGEAPVAEEAGEQDMLAYLDGRVASQEDVKDVRCYSSVRKIQMFLAGVAIEHDALAVRVEGYVDLVQGVWEQAAARASGAAISASALEGVLDERFPRTIGDDGAVVYRFPEVEEPIRVGADAITDYSDTIEAWRLLQTWAARAEASGEARQPPFSPEALDAFHRFLVRYDIALLRHAKALAKASQRATVGAEDMAAAFADERRPVEP